MKVVADVADSFICASYQNAIPVLRSLGLRNPTDLSFSNSRLDLSAVPQFLRAKSWAIGRLLPGDEMVISDRRAELNPSYLKGLGKAERGEVSIVLRLTGRTPQRPERRAQSGPRDLQKRIRAESTASSGSPMVLARLLVACEEE